MEKIKLKNGVNLEIHRITNILNTLELVFLKKDIDIEEMERIFMEPSALETISLTAEDESIMNIYKNYGILRRITKEKEAIEDKQRGGKLDTITVYLEQLPAVMDEIKKIKEQMNLHNKGMEELGEAVSLHDGAIMELGNLVSELEGGEGN